jgi:AcrR family transcriptional regulator
VTGWLEDDRAARAREQLVEAAALLFAERGVAAVGMADVAAAAGCSRATLYRYFPNRDELRLAFVDREARRIAAGVASAVEGIDDPHGRLVAAVLAALAAVREDDTSMAWFRAENAGAAVAAAHASTVIERLASAFLEGDAPSTGGRSRPSSADADAAAVRSEWLVRAIVSLLLVPGATPAHERALVDVAVAPLVVAS